MKELLYQENIMYVSVTNFLAAYLVQGLTLKRLGYFGGWKEGGGGGHDGPPLRSQPWIARSPQKFAQW